MNNQSFITFPIFNKFPEILCAFSTRLGGFSQGPYSSLNMGLNTGDSREIILKNRHIFFDNFGISKKHITFQKQIHSANVKVVLKTGNYPDTDSLFTTVPGIFLTVQTADCVPIFIYSPAQHAVAIVHAGWRGVLAGILNNTLALFKTKTGDNLINLFVALGPSIGKTCFAVKKDVYSKIPKKFLGIHLDQNKRYLDLQFYLKTQLIQSGILSANIYIDESCTHCDSERFFSYRRDGNKSGRMLGLIGLFE